MNNTLWKLEELQIVRRHYPVGGFNACLPYLPGRTEWGVKKAAQRLKVKAPFQKEKRHSWTTNEFIDNAIRETYTLGPTRDKVTALAKRVCRPRWWVSKRATQLGVVVRVGDRPWSRLEIQILDIHVHKSLRIIQRELKKSGFHRTEGSISHKRSKLDLLPRNDQSLYHSRQLAGLMGVNEKLIVKWINGGMLKAKKSGGGQWQIRDRDIKQFILEYTAVFDIRRVDKFWFVDLLGRPSRHRTRMQEEE
jgi:hypothetical protein